MFISPYEKVSIEGSRCLKANFHVHAWPLGSGHKDDVAGMVSLYKEAGYDALMIAGQGSFSDTSLVGKEFGIMTINGIEYVERDGILCVGINSFITGSPQQAIDDCAAQGGSLSCVIQIS